MPDDPAIAAVASESSLSSGDPLERPHRRNAPERHFGQILREQVNVRAKREARIRVAERRIAFRGEGGSFCWKGDIDKEKSAQSGDCTLAQASLARFV